MSFREIGIDLVIEKSLDFMLFEMETLKRLTITVTRSDLCLKKITQTVQHRELIVRGKSRCRETSWKANSAV